MIEEDVRQPLDIFVDACTTSCGALCQAEAYHTVFPQHILEQEWPIYELWALNAAVVLKLWAPTFVGRRVSRYSDSSTAETILQSGKHRNSHIQASSGEIWLPCDLHDITLMCTHTLGDSLFSTADAIVGSI